MPTPKTTPGPRPLVPRGHRVTEVAEREMLRRLRAGWPNVLVRTYESSNMATTVAYKMTHAVRWRKAAPQGKALHFYTGYIPETAEYGVFVRMGSAGKGASRG